MASHDETSRRPTGTAPPATDRDAQPPAQTQLSDAQLAAALARVSLPGSFACLLPELRGHRVLDLGCNQGDYLQFCGPGSLGLDVAAQSVAACRARGLLAQQHDLNLLPLPVPDHSFDTALVSHVLEHVHAPLLLLREVSRALRPGGRIVVGLPIEDSLYSRLRMNYYGGGEGHIYSFSRPNLRKLLHLCGFADPRFVCHLPRLGNQTSGLAKSLNQQLLRFVPAALLYPLSAAYWCLATKVQEPQPDHAFSDYFK